MTSKEQTTCAQNIWSSDAILQDFVSVYALSPTYLLVSIAECQPTYFPLELRPQRCTSPQGYMLLMIWGKI